MNSRSRALLKVVLAVLLALTLTAFVQPATVHAQQQAPQQHATADAGDPGGTSTGSAKDVTLQTPGKPTLDDALAAVGHNRIAINFMWTLIAGFLVMFMQAGFAMVETGFTRAKNAAHTMSMNFMVYAIGMLGFWICGYAIQMGGVGALATLGGATPLNHELSVTIAGKTFGLMGLKGFFLSGTTYDVGIFALFLFQMVFMDTAATIPTGAMAERWKFSSFVLFAFFMSMVVYPLFANWVWGGGWLSQLGTMFHLGHGHVDFAGSSVVHLVGGVAALAGAIVLGPRIGKFTRDGTPRALAGHDIPMAMVGTFILAFGWFGFNAGSSLAGSDLRISVVATNTMLASASGAFAAMVYVWRKTGKPDPAMLANGMLAGLVAITAPCAFVNSVSAVLVGAVAGVLVVAASWFVERRLKVDDPVGAVAVHGVNGAWGVLALGVFADGTYGDGLNGVAGNVRGLLYGDPTQLLAQGIGVLTCVVFVFGAFYGFFRLVDVLVGNRVSAAVELNGLDVPEMGARAYPEFALVSQPAVEEEPEGRPAVDEREPISLPALRPAPENG